MPLIYIYNQFDINSFSEEPRYIYLTQINSNMFHMKIIGKPVTSISYNVDLARHCEFAPLIGFLADKLKAHLLLK